MLYTLERTRTVLHGPRHCWVLYLYKGSMEMSVGVSLDLRVLWVLSSFTRSPGEALSRVVIVQTLVDH